MPANGSPTCAVCACDLLGDRVLQNVAWKVADQLGWSDTLDAEYVALTQLQADALITLDQPLVRAVEGLVTVAPIEALSDLGAYLLDRLAGRDRSASD
jgi:hypothetical protein